MFRAWGERLGEVCSSLGAWIVTIGAAALDGVMPRQCFSCAQPLWRENGLCASCWSKLTLIDAPLCDQRGLPFAYDPGEGVYSAAALARPATFARARAAAAFDDVSRGLVHALKYHDRHEVVRFMARLMVRAGRELLREVDIVASVPLHRTRLWQRRYNQSALLAREIACHYDRRCENELLHRVRATRAQVGLDHRRRRQNVHGAFRIDKDKRAVVRGRRILLVDDVLTTGATADSCARSCLESGAAAVDVLVFALVLDPTRLHV
ncbi:MAG: ComF family protein [Hyphomicrobiales bacterium]